MEANTLYLVIGSFWWMAPAFAFVYFNCLPSDTFFYLFVHFGSSPRQTCCYGQHSQQWHALPHARPQPLVTVSLSDMTDKSGKQNLWENLWNPVPALPLSLCKDDLMFSEHCVMTLTWSWDRQGSTKRELIFLTDMWVWLGASSACQHRETNLSSISQIRTAHHGDTEGSLPFKNGNTTKATSFAGVYKN